MATRVGVTYVDTDGFLAFTKEHDSGAWKPYDITAWAVIGAGPSLLQAPFILASKVRMDRAIRSLMLVLQQMTSANLAALDTRWDSLQRRLHYRTAELAESEDPKISNAALRVRAATLKGEGTGQTSLSYQKEVAWGRKQCALCSAKPLADDVALLGLNALLQEIEQATEDFSAALDISGLSGDSAEATARNDRLLSAKAECRQAFNAAISGLEWQLQQKELTADERASVENCLAPLYALLSRYATTDPQPLPETPAPQPPPKDPV